MRRARRTTFALVAAAAIAGGGGTALAHGGHGGPGGRGGDGGPGGRGAQAARVCTVPDAQKLTVDTSTALKNLDARLKAAVTAGRITQAQADARFARAVTRLSVDKLVNDARMKPVLDLLGMTAQELRDARDDGTTMAELLEEKGISTTDFRAAVTAGRTAARTTRDTLCPVQDDTTTTTPSTTTTTTTA